MFFKYFFSFLLKINIYTIIIYIIYFKKRFYKLIKLLFSINSQCEMLSENLIHIIV